MTNPELLAAAIAILLLAVLVALVIVLIVRQSAVRPEETALRLLQQQLTVLSGQLPQTVARLTSDLNQQIAALHESVASRLAENVQAVQTSGQQVGNRLGEALQAVGEVRQQLGQLREASERIREVGQDVSGLKQLLQAPQFRGGLGEFLLEELLAQLFPKEFFSMPYTFESGERVDAVLRIGRGLIPVDSKFPLDSFRRLVEAGAGSEGARAARRQFRADVRKHLDDVARKYIRPQENFYDFALMYIPAENVYYESIIREEDGGEEDSLFEYALARRVIPVSPHTLFAYLQVIALGLKGMKVEERAEKILAALGQLEVDLGKLQGSFDKVGTQLQYAVANFGEARRRLSEFTQHLALLSALPEDSIGLRLTAGASEKTLE